MPSFAFPLLWLLVTWDVVQGGSRRRVDKDRGRVTEEETKDGEGSFE